MRPTLLIVLVAMALSLVSTAAGQNPLDLLKPQEPTTEEEAPPPEPPGVDDLLPGSPLEADTWKRLGDRLAERLVESIPDLLYALIALAFFLLVYLALAGVLTGVFKRTKADPALEYIVRRLVKYGLLVLALITVASQLGFQVGSLLAGVGVLGLAIGLAAQDTLANLVAGFTILWDRPFRTGDNVTIADTFGRVIKVGLRSTWIRTVDQLDAILPNKEVINQKIINHTLYPQLRLSIPVGIAYWEDSREARQVLLAAVEDNPLLAAEPKPDVVVTALADSSVNLDLRVWLKDPHSEREARWAMTELAKVALDEAGIEIPFPQRTLHLDTATQGAIERLAGGGTSAAADQSERET